MWITPKELLKIYPAKEQTMKTTTDVDTCCRKCGAAAVATKWYTDGKQTKLTICCVSCGYYALIQPGVIHDEKLCPECFEKDHVRITEQYIIGHEGCPICNAQTDHSHVFYKNGHATGYAKDVDYVMNYSQRTLKELQKLYPGNKEQPNV